MYLTKEHTLRYLPLFVWTIPDLQHHNASAILFSKRMPGHVIHVLRVQTNLYRPTYREQNSNREWKELPNKEVHYLYNCFVRIAIVISTAGQHRTDGENTIQNVDRKPP